MIITKEGRGIPISHMIPLFGHLRVSYSHIALRGCIDMEVASKTLISKSKQSKFGIAEQIRKLQRSPRGYKTIK